MGDEILLEQGVGEGKLVRVEVGDGSSRRTEHIYVVSTYWIIVYSGSG